MTLRNFVRVSSISSSSYVYCRLVAALVTLRRVRPNLKLDFDFIDKYSLRRC